jgi:hypothetical protein
MWVTGWPLHQTRMLAGELWAVARPDRPASRSAGATGTSPGISSLVEEWPFQVPKLEEPTMDM